MFLSLLALLLLKSILDNKYITKAPPSKLARNPEQLLSKWDIFLWRVSEASANTQQCFSTVWDYSVFFGAVVLYFSWNEELVYLTVLWEIWVLNCLGSESVCLFCPVACALMACWLTFNILTCTLEHLLCEWSNEGNTLWKHLHGCKNNPNLHDFFSNKLNVQIHIESIAKSKNKNCQ